MDKKDKTPTMIQNTRIGQFTRRMDCRFCGGNNLATILDLGNMPLAGGFLKKEDFINEKYYPLELNFCEDCFLVQVSNIVPPEVLFKNYFYFSSSIKTLVSHFIDFADHTKKRFLNDTKGPSVFELGCNDGSLLKPFAKIGIKAVGIDPAENVVKSIESKEITVINDFFNEKIAVKIREKYGAFDAFLSSYSFAHIDNMVDIMKGLKSLLKPDGVFIFEVYYLGTLLDEMQYDMIYHEHLSYYSLKTLGIFLKKFDMEIFDLEFIPGVRAGAVRFYAKNIGMRNEVKSEAVDRLERYENNKRLDKIETFDNYADRILGLKKQLLKFLNKIKGDDKAIIGYGASGRSTIIMNYCGIDNRYLDYVVDDAPAKHNLYTPGTHLPIRPWDFATKEKFPDYALLFAWSFANEVIQRRKEYLNAGGKFIVPLPKVRIITE